MTRAWLVPDDQLARRPLPIGDHRAFEDDRAQLGPLAVLTRLANSCCSAFEILERTEFGLEFVHRTGRGCRVDYFFLEQLDLFRVQLVSAMRKSRRC